jgi:hypothetical protein
MRCDGGSKRRLGERLRTRSGISGNGEQELGMLKAVALAETFAKG